YITIFTEHSIRRGHTTTTTPYPIRWSRLDESTFAIMFYQRPCFYLKEVDFGHNKSILDFSTTSYIGIIFYFLFSCRRSILVSL
ncbi:hypothetical protein RYX36_028250, partial [Vicia faba]